MADKPERLNERYTLWEKIASGGMADVYRATEYGAKGSSKTVALKKILSSFSSHPDYKKMFIDEGIIGSQLTHTNICQVNPLIEIDDNLYIPMEFIEGKNLRQVINKYKKKNSPKPLPLPFTLFVINEVFKGLDYAHSAQSKSGDDSGKLLNIVHRDMSPQNIMLSYQGGVKLIDFGIAKAKILTNETKAGVIKGKYSYMSPEQAIGQSLGPQSDIFSTGIVFWEMLTGERLFQSDNDMATLKAIQDCDFKNLEPIKKNPEVTPELNKIVMKVLTKDLSLRYKNADLIQYHIQKYINEKFSSYSSKNVRRFLEELFVEEIVAEHKKAKELYGTTLSNSQQKSISSNKDNWAIEKALEGSITNTDMSQSVGVTRTDVSLPENLEPINADSSIVKVNENDSTLLEISQKTSVSLEQDKFKIPSIFSEEKKLETPVENSITKTGAAEEPLIKLDLPVEMDPSLLNQENSNANENSFGSDSWNSVGKLKLDSDFNSKIEITESESQNIGLDNTGTGNTQNKDDLSGFEYNSSPKQSQRWVAYVAVFSVFAAGYMYKLIFTGNMGSIFNIFTNRGPTANPQVNPKNIESLKNISGTKPTNFQCQIQVETDPPGANIVGDNFSGSSSTGNILAPCDQSVVLRIEKNGYEIYKIPVDTTNKPRQIIPRVNLQPIREGAIVLTIDNNAKLEIDGRPAGEVKANIPTEYRVAPGIRKFVFKNEVLGIQAVKEVQILDKERKVENQTIKLTDIDSSPR